MVGETLIVGDCEADTVLLLVLVAVVVPEGVVVRVPLPVGEPVEQGVGVRLSEDPEDGVLLWVGVGDGEASTVPRT
jgi:hypothetical protein